MHGHRGYTGTIAEKGEFATVEVPAWRRPREFIAASSATDEEHRGPAMPRWAGPGNRRRQVGTRGVRPDRRGYVRILRVGIMLKKN